MDTQDSQAQCSCATAPKLIFACSGASDVGGLTDRAARQMTVDQTGKMYCLAGIGGRVEGIMANAKAAAKILVIGRCKEECARRTLELAGIKGFEHLNLEEMGVEKGKTRDRDENPAGGGRRRGVAGVLRDAADLKPGAGGTDNSQSSAFVYER